MSRVSLMGEGNQIQDFATPLPEGSRRRMSAIKASSL